MVPGMGALDDPAPGRISFLARGVQLLFTDAPDVRLIGVGSGSSMDEVRELLKHYKRTRKMMKTFRGDRKLRRQLMKKFSADDFDLSNL